MKTAKTSAEASTRKKLLTVSATIVQKYIHLSIYQKIAEYTTEYQFQTENMFYRYLSLETYDFLSQNDVQIF